MLCAIGDVVDLAGDGDGIDGVRAGGGCIEASHSLLPQLAASPQRLHCRIRGCHDFLHPFRLRSLDNSN